MCQPRTNSFMCDEWMKKQNNTPQPTTKQHTKFYTHLLHSHTNTCIDEFADAHNIPMFEKNKKNKFFKVHFDKHEARQVQRLY